MNFIFLLLAGMLFSNNLLASSGRLSNQHVYTNTTPQKLEPASFEDFSATFPDIRLEAGTISSFEYQTAGIYWLPDYVSKNGGYGYGGRTNDNPPSGNDNSCADYGFEACQAPKTLRPGAKPVQVNQGLKCYRSEDCYIQECADVSLYPYDITNCFANVNGKIISKGKGESCSDAKGTHFKECSCADEYPVISFMSSYKCADRYGLGGAVCGCPTFKIPEDYQASSDSCTSTPDAGGTRKYKTVRVKSCFCPETFMNDEQCAAKYPNSKADLSAAAMVCDGNRSSKCRCPENWKTCTGNQTVDENAESCAVSTTKYYSRCKCAEGYKLETTSSGTESCVPDCPQSLSCRYGCRTYGEGMCYKACVECRSKEDACYNTVEGDFVKVTTEAELRSAVGRNKKKIVIDNDITIEIGLTLNLAPGQSLIGGNWLKCLSEPTKLNFNYGPGNRSQSTRVSNYEQIDNYAVTANTNASLLNLEINVNGPKIGTGQYSSGNAAIILNKGNNLILKDVKLTNNSSCGIVGKGKSNVTNYLGTVEVSVSKNTYAIMNGKHNINGTLNIYTSEGSCFGMGDLITGGHPTSRESVGEVHINGIVNIKGDSTSRGWTGSYGIDAMDTYVNGTLNINLKSEYAYASLIGIDARRENILKVAPEGKVNIFLDSPYSGAGIDGSSIDNKGTIIIENQGRYTEGLQGVLTGSSTGNLYITSHNNAVGNAINGNSGFTLGGYTRIETFGDDLIAVDGALELDGKMEIIVHGKNSYGIKSEDNEYGHNRVVFGPNADLVIETKDESSIPFYVKSVIKIPGLVKAGAKLYVSGENCIRLATQDKTYGDEIYNGGEVWKQSEFGDVCVDCTTAGYSSAKCPISN